MPVRKEDWDCPEHLTAQWNVWDDETGEMGFKTLTPDDALPLMGLGYTVPELVHHFGCPGEVVEHIIACIPEFMVWKSRITTNGGRRLPQLEVSDG